MTALVFSHFGVFQVPGHCDRWLELNGLHLVAHDRGNEQLAAEYTQRMRAHIEYCEQCGAEERYEDDPGIEYQLTARAAAMAWEALDE